MYQLVEGLNAVLISSKIDEESKAEIKELDDRMNLYTFVVECRRLINESSEKNEEEIKEFLEVIQRIEKMGKDTDDNLVTKGDCVCGGAAVLLI